MDITATTVFFLMVMIYHMLVVEKSLVESEGFIFTSCCELWLKIWLLIESAN